jgi:hypothetical protein
MCGPSPHDPHEMSEGAESAVRERRARGTVDAVARGPSITPYASVAPIDGPRRSGSVVGTVLLLVLGVGAGFVVGRESVTSAADQVADVRRTAAEAATAVERLDDEYAKALEAGKSPSGVLGSLTSLRSDVADLLDDAPWVTETAGDAVLDTVDAAKQGADDSVLLDDFQDLLDASAAAIRGVFGA